MNAQSNGRHGMLSTQPLHGMCSMGRCSFLLSTASYCQMCCCAHLHHMLRVDGRIERWPAGARLELGVRAEERQPGQRTKKIASRQPRKNYIPPTSGRLRWTRVRQLHNKMMTFHDAFRCSQVLWRCLCVDCCSTIHQLQVKTSDTLQRTRQWSPPRAPCPCGHVSSR